MAAAGVSGGPVVVNAAEAEMNGNQKTREGGSARKRDGGQGSERDAKLVSGECGDMDCGLAGKFQSKRRRIC